MIYNVESRIGLLRIKIIYYMLKGVQERTLARMSLRAQVFLHVTTSKKVKIHFYITTSPLACFYKQAGARRKSA